MASRLLSLCERRRKARLPRIILYQCSLGRCCLFCYPSSYLGLVLICARGIPKGLRRILATSFGVWRPLMLVFHCFRRCLHTPSLLWRGPGVAMHSFGYSGGMGCTFWPHGPRLLTMGLQPGHGACCTFVNWPRSSSPSAARQSVGWWLDWHLLSACSIEVGCARGHFCRRAEWWCTVYARVHGGSGFAVCVPMSAVLEYDIAHHGSLVAGFRFVLGAELARRVLLRPLPGG